MPSTYTTNNGIEIIATGEQSGTWGDTTNTNLQLLDQSLDGQVTVVLPATGTSGSPNQIDIVDGTASDGRNRMVIFSDAGDLGGTAYVQLTPSDAEKVMFVRNSLTASRSILIFQGTYSTSNDYEVKAGTTVVLRFDGGGAGAVVTNVFDNAYFDALQLGSVSVTSILDEDNMASDSATALATQQSIKAYVDSQVTAQDLDFAGDTGTGAVDLDSQSFTVAGTANEIATSASGQTITIGLPTTVNISTLNATTAQLATIQANDGTPAGSIANTTGVVTLSSTVLSSTDINGGAIDNTAIGATTPSTGAFTTLTAGTSFNVGSTVNVVGVLDDDTMATATDTSLATSESIKAYVDSQVTAQDLDFAGDTGTGAVDLDSQSFTVAGTANEIETSATGQTITIGLPTSVTVGTLNTTTLNASGGGSLTGTWSDLGSVTTVDINGGTIDGTVIGGASAAAATVTTLTVNTSATMELDQITSTSDLPVSLGGTGASTAAAARTNLDVDQAGTALALAIALG